MIKLSGNFSNYNCLKMDSKNKERQKISKINIKKGQNVI